MTEPNLNQIDVLVADPDRSSQSVLKTLLGNIGFRNVYFCTTLEEVEKTVIDAQPDLLICDCSLPGGDFFDFVYGIRHNDVGNNPFLTIIAMTQAPSPEIVKRVSECGVDHLVVKPFSTAQMIDRIKLFIEARKFFVVTSDYIGPERKTREEPTEKVTRIAVPNTLRAKASGQATPEAIQKALDLTIAEINIQRLERYDEEISVLVERIVPDLESGVTDGDVSGTLDRLLFVAGDTGRRLVGTKYAHVSDLCQALHTVTNSIVTSRASPDSRDIQMLRPLSLAIKTGFGTGQATVAAARKISVETLARFRTLQAERSAAEGTAAEPKTSSEPMPPEAKADEPRVVSGDGAKEDRGAEPAEETSKETPAPSDTRKIAAPLQRGETEAGETPTTPPSATADGRGFNEIFIESLCHYIRQRLEPLHIEDTGSEPLPFILSLAFCDRFEEVLGMYVANAIPGNRRLVVLAQSLGKEEIHQDYFDQMFSETNKKQNVPRFLWNAWWDDIKSVLSAEASAASVNKTIEKDAREIWDHIQNGAASGHYDPPQVEDVVLFQALFDYDLDDVRGGLRGMEQVLEHETTGEAQDGASRNYILGQMESKPPHLGEIVALWAYYTRPDFTPEMQKSIVASTGWSTRERRQQLPFYLRWAPDPVRRPANG